MTDLADEDLNSDTKQAEEAVFARKGSTRLCKTYLQSFQRRARSRFVE